MGEGNVGYLFPLSHIGLQPGGQDASLRINRLKGFCFQKPLRF